MMIRQRITPSDMLACAVTGCSVTVIDRVTHMRKDGVLYDADATTLTMFDPNKVSLRPLPNWYSEDALVAKDGTLIVYQYDRLQIRFQTYPIIMSKREMDERMNPESNNESDDYQQIFDDIAY